MAAEPPAPGGPEALAPPPPPQPPYPLQFSVEYPDRPLNRLTTGLRIFTVIPILILLATLGGGAVGRGAYAGIAGGGILFIPVLLMIVFRQKYPRWWWDWNLELLRFQNRVGIYVALMDDRYPSTDEHQSVRLDAQYPDAKTGVNRWLPLVKWFLAIPHYVVLLFLFIASFFVVVFCWFAILFTGRFPRGAFDFLVGVGRWENRVIAYAFLLATDRYPPFSLEP